tara:strand:- start:3721 stop:4917 length:1197 start_codon:yes stop_codon:yes gene_type:complete
MLDPILQKKDEIEQKLNNYLLKGARRGFLLKRAATTSKEEVRSSMQAFLVKPSATSLTMLLRNMFNSGVWVSKSTLELLFSLVRLVEQVNFDPSDEATIQVLKSLKSGPSDANYNDSVIFKAILGERRYCHQNPGHSPLTTVDQCQVHLILISGVFNEIFSTAAFERGANHLKEQGIIDFTKISVNGRKSSRHNAELIHQQLLEIQKEFPDKKLWLLGYSKGGIDALHFLRSHSKQHSNIVGLSTIASPIMGTNHPNHRIIKFLTSFSKFKLYRAIDQGKDLFIQGLQNSLRSDIRHSWFFRNHEKLPKDIFYSALAFQSSWHESHIWMMLTKLLFQSKHPNDGVVDVQFAQFPSFFEAHNLGITEGHHLVGTRSSEYPQEALLEALIIFLKYKNKIN